MLATIAAILSLASASSAIQTYETRYWHSPEAHTTVSQCRRHGPNRVACIAHTVIDNAQELTKINARDEVIREHGLLRVHPGKDVVMEIAVKGGEEP